MMLLLNAFANMTLVPQYSCVRIVAAILLRFVFVVVTKC